MKMSRVSDCLYVADCGRLEIVQRDDGNWYVIDVASREESRHATKSEAATRAAMQCIERMVSS